AASSTSSPSYNSSKVDHFVSMGFAEKRVIQAIKENGNACFILPSLLYSLSHYLLDKAKLFIDSNEPSEADKQSVIEQCKKWKLVFVGPPYFYYENVALTPKGFGMTAPDSSMTLSGVCGFHDKAKLSNDSGEPSEADKQFVIEQCKKYKLVCVGGAEVTLHKLRITLNNVVKPIHVNDVEKAVKGMLDRWIDEFNGFDLMIGGSPGNNLAGGNWRAERG
ncbi:hypothetical protein RDABS01_029536, partial [Bienertia sinuspersici]